MTRTQQYISLLLLLVVSDRNSCHGFTPMNRQPTAVSRTTKTSRFVVLSLNTAAASPRTTALRSPYDDDIDDTDCPRGYYLNSVENSCSPLGPVGKISQVVETFGPFKRAHEAIMNLFGIDAKSLGVSFGLSYSLLSQINGSVTLSVAWYMACKSSGLSPLVPGQWKSLLKAYGTLYAAVQLLRPFRVAGAVAMSKLSKELLEVTEQKFGCSRKVAIAVQYALGWVVWASLASVGVTVASISSGVPLLGVGGSS
eukprot:CAMPEP_0198148812 /NCGR_PEP_ID=MMETSP1443-20131203/43492_1 /TAXON_ID=186043 /ORGANISM="Entomoneis sp., Strain CCMP2396" /LENGTH=253 /DNA_ID=CAMNT_0043813637 /DNA_START=261 /DNA_END=1022 /DNA_ORIENTATION=-